jgi:hypothetical protein
VHHLAAASCLLPACADLRARPPPPARQGQLGSLGSAGQRRRRASQQNALRARRGAPYSAAAGGVLRYLTKGRHPSPVAPPYQPAWMEQGAITFVAGASYGLTTVIVGQPLDTIKTRMQGIPESRGRSMLWVGRDVFAREGLRGLYRGGLPLLLGGSLMRSAQFGVSGAANSLMKKAGLPPHRVLGIFDYQVVLAGMYAHPFTPFRTCLAH